MRFAPRDGLRAYDALYDVIATVGGWLSLYISPDPHKALTGPGGAIQTERGARGYTQARLAASIIGSDGDRVRFESHGRTIEQAARTLLANYPSARPPLRAAL